MTLTSTYDHRVIQGAESGPSCAGSRSFCRGSTASTTACSPRCGPGARPTPPGLFPTARGLPAPCEVRAGDEELLQAVQSATSLVKRFAPTAIWRQSRSARLRAQGRPSIWTREPLDLTAELRPRFPPRSFTCTSRARPRCRGASPSARGLLRRRSATSSSTSPRIDQRVWLRELIGRVRTALR